MEMINQIKEIVPTEIIHRKIKPNPRMFQKKFLAQYTVCIGMYMTLFLPNLTKATQLSVHVSTKEVHNLHSFETQHEHIVIFHPTDY